MSSTAKPLLISLFTLGVTAFFVHVLLEPQQIQAEFSNRFLNPSFEDGISQWNVSAVTPDGWIEVPGNNGLYGTQDFLVMKYEAKAWNTSTDEVVADGGVGSGGWAGGNAQTTYRAVSIADGRPWVQIAQNHSSEYDAILACQDAYELAGLPEGSTQLLTNNQWMTIARNVEQQGDNWTSGTVGTEMMYRGHSDNSPANSLAANSDDSQGYEGTGNSQFQAAGSGKEQRRTLTLSNGQIIWDVSGNVSHWLSDTILGPDKPDSGTTSAWREWTYFNTDGHYGTLSYDVLRPSDTSWNSTQSVGQYFMSARTSGVTYVFVRGAFWGQATNAGVFSLALNVGPTIRGNGTGLRCASDPVEISLTHQAEGGRTDGAVQVSVGSVVPGKISQSLNVGGADIFDFSVYVYDETDGNAGGEVTSSIAQLYYNGEAIATSYTNAGDGWWKLSGTLTGTDEVREYGVQVAEEKIINIDSMNLAKIDASRPNRHAGLGGKEFRISTVNGEDYGNNRTIRTNDRKPTIRFNRSVDDASGLDYYQIRLYDTDVLGRKSGREYAWIDNIPDEPATNSERIRYRDGFNIKYRGDTIVIEQTTGHKYELKEGIYFMRVRAFDKAGNSRTTSEIRLIIDAKYTEEYKQALQEGRSLIADDTVLTLTHIGNIPNAGAYSLFYYTAEFMAFRGSITPAAEGFDVQVIVNGIEIARRPTNSDGTFNVPARILRGSNDVVTKIANLDTEQARKQLTLIIDPTRQSFPPHLR